MSLIGLLSRRMRFLGLVVLAGLSSLAHGERLRIVSDDWAPYLYQENGQAKGIDYEITNEVFKRLGVEVQWQFLPWKRCLAMVEQGLADAVMDIFKVDSRQDYMVYPDEPMSQVEFVLYQARSRPHPVVHLEDLAGLTVGTSPVMSTTAASQNRRCFAVSLRPATRPTSAS